ncbi:MAG TPA: hypothetical protein VFQ61_27150 [Polyangiaceae bacterium]|nr:hypothetical protein [Polyangiaceae bacterium]
MTRWSFAEGRRRLEVRSQLAVLEECELLVCSSFPRKRSCPSGKLVVAILEVVCAF